MEVPKDTLSARQLAIIIMSTILGIDGFIMPRLVTQAAGRDGWVSLVLGSFWIFLVTGGLAYLAGFFPRQPPQVWLSQLFGRWAARIFILAYIIYFLVMSAWSLRIFSDMARIYLLHRTPSEVIMISMLLSVVYLVGHGINPMGRLTLVFFPFTIIPFVLISIMTKSTVDLGEFLPVLAQGILPVVKGFPPATAVFIGWGIMLYLIQFMDKPREAIKAGAVGIGILAVFFLWSFIVTVASFGPTETKYLLYPLIDLVREAEGVGGFVEKMDLFLLAFWIMTAFVTIAFTYYVAVLASSQLMELQERRSLIYLGLPLVYLLARLPKGSKGSEGLGIWLSYVSLGLSIFLVAIIVWILAKKRRGGLSNEDEV